MWNFQTRQKLEFRFLEEVQCVLLTHVYLDSSFIVQCIISNFMVNEAMKLKDAYSLEEELSKPRQHIKRQTSLCQQRSIYSKLWFFQWSCTNVKLDQKEGWAWKNWPFKLWCWGILLIVSWIARKSNQSILKEINTEYSLKGLMLKLKFQYFGHLTWGANSLEKTLILGKMEGERRRGSREWNG